MNFRKVLKLCIITFFAVLLAGCKLPSLENGSENNPSNNPSLPSATSPEFKKINYKFRVSRMPYDSVGLKIYAQVEASKYRPYSVLLGEIESVAKGACLEKTVELPEEYDTLYLYFVDVNNKTRYYNRVRKEYYYNDEKDYWDVDGYYYYYYQNKRELSSPYAAISEDNLADLEYGIKYEFDGSKMPYLVFQADNVKDKVLHFAIDGDSSKVELDISTDKTKFMTYKAERIIRNFYECDTQKVYIMLRPLEYDFSENAESPKCTFTITDFSSEIENCFTIDKACVASNGKIYASGTAAVNLVKNALYCIDPNDSFSRTKIKNFDDDIYTVGELEEGIVYVSYKDCISKVDIATGNVTELVKNLGIKTTNVAMYKTGDLVVIGEELHTTAEHGYLVNTTTGESKELQYKQYPYDLYSTKNLQYIPEKDLFIYERNGSPLDVSFLKLDITDPSEPKYVTKDSRYHGDYKFYSPITVFSTSPLQLLTAYGEILNVNVDLIDNNDPTTDEHYGNKIENWCTYEDVLCKTYKNCYINGEYIYYLNYDSTGKNCIIEKCAKTEPKTVLTQKSYAGEAAIDFYKAGENLYLLTNSAESVYSGDYRKVYLHEIDF